MSLPKFPEVPEITIEKAICMLLTGIAMEELGLSHIINAEGEKLQYILGTLPYNAGQKPTADDVLKINNSINEVLKNVSINQKYLSDKMCAAMEMYLKDKNITDGTNPPDPPPTEINPPSAYDGRILDKDKAGDSADWVEVAKNNGFSLVVRSKFINVIPINKNDPNFQNIKFGTDNNYKTSILHEKINNWFTGNAEGDNLDETANIRKFTVKNTSLENTGTGTNGTDGISNGFSKPIPQKKTQGEDVAFALSYSEAASFISTDYSWGPGQTAESGEIARKNFAKIDIPNADNSYNKIWLRSPGITFDSACELSGDGMVFQEFTNDTALVYPALWVDSSVFGE